METNSNPKILVKIDPEVKQLIPSFLKNHDTDISEMQKSLTKEDFEHIERIGHGMKGAGAGFGFDYISELGAFIETAAKQRDIVTIQKKITELVNYLQSIEVVYE